MKTKLPHFTDTFF